MRKLINMATCLLLFLSILYVTVFADPINVSVAFDTGKLSVFGDLGDAGANKYVSLKVVDNNVDLTAIDTSSNEQKYSEALKYLAVIKTDNKGNYSFPLFSFEGDSDFYTICITQSDKSSMVYSVKDFFIPTTANINNFISKFNASSATDMIKTLLDNERENVTVGFDFTFYNMLSDTAKLKMADMMFENLPYNKATEIYDDINSFSVISGLLNTKSTEQIKYFLKPELSNYTYKQKIMISNALGLEKLFTKSTTNKLFNSYTESECNNVLNKVLSGNYSDLDSLYDLIDISIINSEIASIGDWNKVNGVINSFKDVLTCIDYNKYNNASNRSKIDKNLQSKAFTSVSQLCEYINSSVEEDSDTPHNNSPKGSGGGGSTGRKTYYADVAVVEEIKKPAGKMLFTDIEGVSWAEGAINYLYNKEVLSGKETGKFYPNDLVTREEFVKMFVKAFGFTSSEECKFADVPKDSWYYPYINAAYKNGLINGVDDLNFGVGNTILRQDVAVIISRALGKSAGINTDMFNDYNTIDEYAKESVAYLAQNEILNGFEDGTFMPKQGCTRAQAAKIIYKLIQISGKD